MRRREFIALLGGAAAAWPSVARAQQPERTRRIGVVMGYAENDPEARARIGVFLAALSAAGWSEKGNLQIDYRWVSADVGLTKKAAKELVALNPDVIVANTTPVTAAVQRETSSIPIVFVIVSDPVGAGFVKSLSRPGGNITGFINFEGSMGGKWIELLKEVAPKIKQAAILYNPDTAPGGGEYFLPSFESGARSLGLKPVSAPVRSAEEIENTVRNLPDKFESGLVAMTDSFLTVHRKILMTLAERYKLPALYPLTTSAKEGGLIGYGPDYHDLFRRSAGYVDRILRGEEVADLPVQVPVKFELVLNLNAAKSIGLEIPLTVIARADEVIE